MSQSATFYPIEKKDFLIIEGNPADLEILSGRDNYVTFAGTHEGLRFVLSKGMKEQEMSLITELFYPKAHVGEDSAIAFSDEVNETDIIYETEDENYDDFDKEPVAYHAPEKIKQIASLLNSINEEGLLAQFDPEELNRERIYPWC